MIEIITVHTDNRRVCHEVESGGHLYLADDVHTIEVSEIDTNAGNVEGRIRRAKRKGIDSPFDPQFAPDAFTHSHNPEAGFYTDDEGPIKS